MKTFMTAMMAGVLAYAPAAWAENSPYNADAYQASLMAFGLSETAARETAAATIAELEKRRAGTDTAETAETTDVYSTISAAWLENPYHVD